MRLDDHLRADLARVIRRRVDAREVEDVVHATLLEVAAAGVAKTPEDVRHLSLFVARQKIADVHRRRARDARHVPLDTCPEPPAPPYDPTTARACDDLLRWTARTLPKTDDAARTFAWMLREGDGEALSEIAAVERVPAAVVRQRVSRLRRFLRARWAREVGAIALVVAALGSIGWWELQRRPEAAVRPEPAPAPTAAAPTLVEPPQTAVSTTPAVAPRPAAPAVSCDPPYTVDGEGRRHFKRACFGPARR